MGAAPASMARRPPSAAGPLRPADQHLGGGVGPTPGWASSAGATARARVPSSLASWVPPVGGQARSAVARSARTVARYSTGSDGWAFSAAHSLPAQGPTSQPGSQRLFAVSSSALVAAAPRSPCQRRRFGCYTRSASRFPAVVRASCRAACFSSSSDRVQASLLAWCCRSAFADRSRLPTLPSQPVAIYPIAVAASPLHLPAASSYLSLFYLRYGPAGSVLVSRGGRGRRTGGRRQPG